MNTKCPRCKGKKIFNKECCIKCGGRGYLTKNDKEIIRNIKNIYLRTI